MGQEKRENSFFLIKKTRPAGVCVCVGGGGLLS